MSLQFDPYYKWLAIPKHDQPPNYYRLLGVALFEDDSEVISNAADQRMMILHTFQNGERGSLSQQILNEVAAASACLLDSEAKSRYDANLKVDTSPENLSDGGGSADALPGDTSSFALAPALIRLRSYISNSIVATCLTVCAIVVVIGAILASVSDPPPEPRRDPLADYWAQQRENSKPREATTSTIPQSQLPLETDEQSTNRAGPKPPLHQPPVATIRNGNEVFATGASDDRAPPEHPTMDRRRTSPSHPSVNKSIESVEPDVLQKANQAIDQENIHMAITHLEQYLGGNPRPPYKERAVEHLRQAKLAVSNEAAIEFLRNYFETLPDHQIRKIMQRSGDFDVTGDASITNPILQRVFSQKLSSRENQSIALMDRLVRLNRPIPSDDATKTSRIVEKTEDTTEPEPRAELITDPSEFLASKDLIQTGNRWIMKRESGIEELHAKVRKKLAAYTTIAKQMKSLTSQNVAEHRRLIEINTELDAIRTARLKRPNNSYVQNESARLRQLDNQRTELQGSIIASNQLLAKTKVTVANRRREVERLLTESEELIAIVNKAYQQCQNDENITGALEKVGGRLGPSHSFKSASSAAQRIRKKLRNDAKVVSEPSAPRF